jgi:hypothetical protein
MKWLVIPDVHQRIGLVDKILKHETYDAVVWLGDFFDNFNDTVLEAAKTARWLKRRMEEHPEDLFVLGNHDAHYAFPFDGFRCSGYTYDKMKTIREVLSINEWNRFNLFVQVDDWTMSHAGFHSDLAHPKTGFKDIEWMAAQENSALEQASYGKVHPWLAAGVSRGGWMATGGVNWLDWDNEFKPVPGLNQIVGHTPHEEPQRRRRDGSINWGLDTHNRHYGVIQDGILTIHKTMQPLDNQPKSEV